MHLFQKKFNNDRKVTDFLRHISESCTYNLNSVIFQEVLHILYFKIIPTISKKFDRNFWGPKLAHTLYSPLEFLIFIYHKYFKHIWNKSISSSVLYKFDTFCVSTQDSFLKDIIILQ